MTKSANTASASLVNTELQPSVFGVEFTERGLNEIAEAVTARLPPAGGGLWLLVTMNLDHAVTLWRDASFRRAYRQARLVTADGFPIYLYARWRGARLAGRVTGADLFPLIMQRLKPKRHRPFMVASCEATRERLEQRLAEARFEADQYAVVVPPFGFERDAGESEMILARIEALRPTHIFMGVGSPKSEIWFDRHRDRMGDAYGFAFGAGLNFFAGTSRRAPKVVREAGFEWLWRFASEPRRLFKRYFIDSWLFLAVIANDLWHNGHPRVAVRTERLRERT
jgi:N-acetylglucosaminyldiphosphoundecaprenol N-acetyl-beta-D-mannosaminyltransferase